MESRRFYIDTINKTVNLNFEKNREIRERVKDCDRDAHFNPELVEWIVPVNDWSLPRIMRLIKEYEFNQYKKDLGENVEYDYSVHDIDLAYLRGMVDVKDFLYDAWEYQLLALGYGMKKGNILNGDDVGLGKTFESILYAECTNSFPCLVIAPSSVKVNWMEKWVEITKNRRLVSYIDGKKGDWNADVVVINYDIIGKKAGRGATPKYKELLDIEWKMLICDEAHFVKNSSSIRTKATKRIAKKIRENDGIIQLLTGTATQNKPSELWELFGILDVQELFGGNWQVFIQRYCGAYRGKFGWNTDGATNILELNRIMRDNFYIRREKREVSDEMPDVVRQVIHVPITNKKQITEAVTDFISYVENTKGEEAADKAMAAEKLVALGEMRKLSIQGKMKAIEKYLSDWKESGEKLIVFGLHREPLDTLHEKFGGKLIVGGMGAAKKQQAVKDFMASDDIFLFANMTTAGTGVDGLQYGCSNMLIIELPWRPSDLVQTIGRLDRTGQEESVTVTFALSDDTIDKEMWEMLEEKELVTEAVNKGIDIRKENSGINNVIKRMMKKV